MSCHRASCILCEIGDFTRDKALLSYFKLCLLKDGAKLRNLFVILQLKFKDVYDMTQLCPKCGCSKFQLQNIDIENTSYAFVSIQCKVCGHTIGVTTLENAPATIVKYGKKTLDKLDDVERKLNQK